MNSRIPLVVCDLCGGTLVTTVHQVDVGAADELLQYLPLQLEQVRSTDQYQFESSQLLKTDAEQIRGGIFLVGYTADPFDGGRFPQALALLEQIAALSPRKVVIQTRSPLLLLGMPVLRALGERVEIRVAIDALSDAAGRQYLPELPRPSERIALARSLRRLGIPAGLQITPVPGKTQRSVSALEEFIAEAPVPIQLVALERMLEGRARWGIDETAALLDRSNQVRTRLQVRFPAACGRTNSDKMAA